MPRYTITAVDVFASSIELHRPPRVPPQRELPQDISHELRTEIAKTVDIYAARDAVRWSAPFDANTVPDAARIARQRFEDAINQYRTKPVGPRVVFDGVSPVYRRTSNGGHETIGWAMLDDPKGRKPWEYTLNVATGQFKAYVSVAVVTLEIAPSSPVVW